MDWWIHPPFAAKKGRNASELLTQKLRPNSQSNILNLMVQSMLACWYEGPLRPDPSRVANPKIGHKCGVDSSWAARNTIIALRLKPGKIGLCIPLIVLHSITETNFKSRIPTKIDWCQGIRGDRTVSSNHFSPAISANSLAVQIRRVAKKSKLLQSELNRADRFATPFGMSLTLEHDVGVSKDNP